MSTVGPPYPSESEGRSEPVPPAQPTGAEAPPPTGSVPAQPTEPGSPAPPAPTMESTWSGSAPPPTVSSQPVAGQRLARPRNGMGVAALVIGVASVVAAASFVLFPLGFIGGVVGLIVGIVALTRRTSGATNSGQATAGVICCVIAVIIAVVFTVRVGTWAARNASVFTNFDKCIAQANDRAAVSDCIAQFANDVRP